MTICICRSNYWSYW